MIVNYVSQFVWALQAHDLLKAIFICKVREIMKHWVSWERRVLSAGDGIQKGCSNVRQPLHYRHTPSPHEFLTGGPKNKPKKAKNQSNKQTNKQTKPFQLQPHFWDSLKDSYSSVAFGLHSTRRHCCICKISYVTPDFNFALTCISPPYLGLF